MGDASRASGGLRLLAWIVDVSAMVVVNQLLHDQRLNAFTQLATIAISVTTEVVWAASPGMLLLGLRVGRPDGVRTRRRQRVAKAALVRWVDLLYVPGAIFTAFGLRHVGRGAADSALPRSRWQWLVMITAFLYFAAFAGAFTARRQTLYDRILGLAVFRARDLR